MTGLQRTDGCGDREIAAAFFHVKKGTTGHASGSEKAYADGEKSNSLCYFYSAAERGRAMEAKTETPISLTERERKMLDLLRGLEYGELRVMVQEGQPVRVEEIRRSIRL